MHPYYSTSFSLQSQSSNAPISALLDNSHIISWNPFATNKFCVVSQASVHYYNVKEEFLKQSSQSANILNDELYDPNEVFSVVSSTNLQTPAKCVAWSPESQTTLALGLQSGRIVLDDSQRQEIVMEFVPRAQRACRCLSWNPVHTNLIAAGYEKARNDNNCLVWDINSVDAESSVVTNLDTASSYQTDRSDAMSFRYQAANHSNR
ncbi:WD repeat-containing protein mio [Acrasis kona]|uniref:WD repeat-containing protein mio n=1 Tax=Acrasis kona TaxID=1008807 RepID=A0AAW2ZIQ0_9EUKA